MTGGARVGDDRVTIPFDGRRIDIEIAWVRPEHAHRPDRPLVVFLHEGLGSVSMWRDYPRMLCEAGDLRGLVLSRYGYGRSTPRPHDEKWGADFMHRQAREALPALFDALEIGPGRRHGKPWLLGHSDGGSIALIHAASFPDAVAGLIVLAPHTVVEDISVRSIAETRRAYLETDLRTRLARYHDDVDSAFWGWNDIWLDPAFRQWDLRPLLPAIACPVLAVQGEDDAYGTMAQIEGIHRYAPRASLLKLARCGHSPHRDQPARLTEAAVDFITTHT
ncbi:alpha/beta fold hydrolase [Cupriavidus plantarum]|uniref:alpha/beta fold hydrolase n=1 Tax=Cupriavidus plantarum TaxID=942865 RepID=UPI000EB03536|nr:alpha/beta hydrolase [Cupriavidus plantarum]RLK44948.1 pimeloyl-ACP methyl ester carboxylesterase [Cupriavidus plantarum]CAG2130366.1 2-succinyl-6-hydroxy-2, 4-cyclohexadiene-1-carboxylate synthase [Cupriavidus plantarum]SMR66148.1 Pimeloyl-ACP methyl ester carboxylesterase [Cupriavidus plantarum]